MLSVAFKTSAFPTLAGSPSRTTSIGSSGLSHAAYALVTPGFTHHLSAMHAGSLQFRRLTYSGGNRAVVCLHPLGSNIQFLKLLSDPKDLNLTRHENTLFHRSVKYQEFVSLPIPRVIGLKIGG